MQLYSVNEFRASKNWPYSISAGCVVYRIKNELAEVLLLERNAVHSLNTTNEPTYNLPKGHVAFSETLQEAAVRETEEEAGVTVELQTYLGSLHKTFTHPVHKIMRDKTTHYFAGLWQADLHSIDSEHDEKVWVSLAEAEKLLGEPNPKNEDKIIRRLRSFLELIHAT